MKQRVTVKYHGQEVGEIGTNGRDTGYFFYSGPWIQGGHELAAYHASA